jgi:hypothetical protein
MNPQLNQRNVIGKYLKEISFTRYYVILVLFVIVGSYSIYFFLDVEQLHSLGDEDKFFEWATAFSLLAAGVMFFLHYLKVVYHLKSRNLFLLALAILMFIGFGEEISWGQRIFNFSTPESLKEINEQKEVSLHNIRLFQRSDHAGNFKTGLARITEINFLFKIFTILFGVILPFMVFHLKSVSRLSRKIKIPVPPISIGIFFIISWITYKAMETFVLLKGMDIQYYDTIYEVMEFVATFILFVISYYLYQNRKLQPLGVDIKQVA